MDAQIVACGVVMMAAATLGEIADHSSGQLHQKQSSVNRIIAKWFVLMTTGAVRDLNIDNARDDEAFVRKADFYRAKR